MRQPKQLCGACGKMRSLRTVTVTYAGQTRQLDMCRTCAAAVKESLRHEAMQEPVNAAA